MLYLFFFLAELLVLFLLSKTLTNSLFAFFHKITRSKKISIFILSFLFLPGTIIHELAHAIMAILLNVPVGKMELIPKLIGTNLKLGSVEVGHADPIRRLLIGISPFLIGISIILGAFFLAVKNNLLTYPLYIVLTGYIVFEIGNTMFSSKKDLEGAIEVMTAIVVICIVFYIVGFRLPALNPELFFSNPLVDMTFQKASLYMLAPLGVNSIFVVFFKLLKY